MVLAVLSKDDMRSRYLLAFAAILMLGAGLVTRFANQPINVLVMKMNAQAPAPNWQQLRDLWWHWHIVRSLAGIAALALALFGILGAKR